MNWWDNTYVRGKRLNDNPHYSIYHQAKQRCENQNCPSFSEYGGRGIKFLFSSFKAFMDELGERPSKEYSLDRINNDGHYEPGNVRWATATQQAMNKRQKRKAKNNTSGVIGVSFDKTHKIWVATAYQNKKQLWLYKGLSFNDAVAAREEWEKYGKRIT